jgi:Ni,Fe-hydrogenase III large subunit
MGPTVRRLQNTVDEIAQDIGAATATRTNTIGFLRCDRSSTISNRAKECIESLRMISQQTKRTT